MNSWEILKTQYKVSDFLSWQRAGSLTLSPSFQRRSVWKKPAKSYLIDTIIRGLPIPIIFLRDRKTNLKTLEQGREVVDGQQRIRTILSFIAPKLLSDFKPERDDFHILKTHNKDYEKNQFKDLPKDIQQKILDYQFSVHVMPTAVGDREVLSIFARMNSTGLRLNDQELRNAEFFGEMKTSIYDSAYKQLERWRAWKIFTEDNIARMDEVELTSELYLFILHGVSGKSNSSLKKLYEGHDKKFPERKEVEKRFEIVMEYIHDYFNDKLALTAFRKKTLFYSLFAVTYDIAYGIKSKVVHTKPKSINSKQVKALKDFSAEIESGQASQKVLDAAARRTTHVSSRTDIINYLKRKVANV